MINKMFLKWKNNSPPPCSWLGFPGGVWWLVLSGGSGRFPHILHPGRVAGRLGSVTSPHPCGLRASSQGPSSRRSDLSQVTQGATHPPGFVEAGSGSCQCPRAVSFCRILLSKLAQSPPLPQVQGEESDTISQWKKRQRIWVWPLIHYVDSE